MSRPLSEPDAYLRRNSEADPKPTKRPYIHWRETKEERRARLRRQDEAFREPQLVSFGWAKELNERFLEEKARIEAELARCVY